MDTPPTPQRVAAVVALKSLPRAKSRLGALSAPVRERLARCMALDTLAALTRAVDEVLVVSDQPDLGAALARHGVTARVVAEPTLPQRGMPERGSTEPLNLALGHGADTLAAAGWPVVLACVGDLPALRPDSVGQVLNASAGWARSFLPDHEDRGTTMLVARGTALDPRYGTGLGSGSVGSAERHERSGAARLVLGELADARWDVDTVEDLRVAARLGLGPATASMIDPDTGAPGPYLPVLVVGREGHTLTVDATGEHQELAVGAYDGDPALLVPGRRLHAVRVAGALRCWS